MASQNKFLKGIVLGALAGGAISLLDKETRKVVVESCKRTTKEVSYYLSHQAKLLNRSENRLIN